MSVFAQEYKTDPVTVSAQRIPSLYSENARVLSIISKEDIQKTNASTINELLEYVASVDVRQRGTPGAQADISIRGGSFDQTLILIDGIPFNDPQTGHHNTNLPIDLNDINSIEVIEGASARSLGINSFSGAINIITNNSKSNNINASVKFGENAFQKYSVSGKTYLDNFSIFASYNKNKCDGYIDNTDLNSQSIYSGIGWAANELSVVYKFGYMDKKFGANSFYTPAYPNQYEEVNSLFNALSFKKIGDFNLDIAAYWRIHDDKFLLNRQIKDKFNFHTGNLYGIDVKSYISSFIGKTAFGFSFKQQEIKSTVLGKKLSSPEKISGENAYYKYSDSRSNIDFFIEQTYKYSNFMISAGALFNINSDYDNHTVGGIDLSYKLDENFTLFSSLNQSLRLPTFTDLYYSDPLHKPNPNLKPEFGLNIELGTKLSFEKLTAQIAIFKMIGKDMIDWVMPLDSTKWEPANLTEIINNGISGSIKYFPNFELLSDINISSFRVEYLYQFPEKTKLDGLKSKYAMNFLRHKINFAFDVMFFESLNLSINQSYSERLGTYVDFKTKKSKDFAPVGLTDIKLNYKYHYFDFYVEMNNIFDRKYMDISNLIQPGRWILAGINVKYE